MLIGISCRLISFGTAVPACTRHVLCIGFVDGWRDQNMAAVRESDRSWSIRSTITHASCLLFHVFPVHDID